MQFRNATDLIFYKSFAELKAETARSYLGLLWWILEPVLYLFAFYVLFVLVLQRGGPDFVPNFLCGAVVWKWFDSGIKSGSFSIITHNALLQQVYVPKYVFPLSAVVVSTVKFVPVFLIFIVFLLVYGVAIEFTWLLTPVVMAVQLLLIVSGAMFVAAITPFLPDLKVAIDNGLMLLFFLSGVFFDINDVQEPIKSYLLLNPMAGLIDDYRSLLIRGTLPDMARLSGIAVTSALFGSLALVLLKKLDHSYGKVRF